MSVLDFEILNSDGRARTGSLLTAHGAIDTPAFMPVGTAATVKASLDWSMLTAFGNGISTQKHASSATCIKSSGLNSFNGW